MSKKTKWGILAAGGIARSFVSDLKLLHNAEVHAVGARSLERSQAFAKEFNIAHAYGSYEELVADPEIEVIYIATLHPQHLEAALLCMNAGKSVLCEKPLAMNAKEVQQMVDCAQENNVFLMEAMWTRYFPAMHKVREWLNHGAIGEVKMLQVDFGFNIGWQPEHRLLKKDLGGGALLDVGIYTVSFASWVYGKQPQDIHSVANIGETGVDESFFATFDYGEGQVARIANGVRLNLQNEAIIFGTEGKITVPSFFAPKQVTLEQYGKTEETFKDHTQARGYTYQAEEVMNCLREGRKQSDLMTQQESLEIMETLDKMRKSWGLRYPSEA